MSLYRPLVAPVSPSLCPGVSLCQAQKDTIEELLRVQDSLEFRETEMEKAKAELRTTKAEVTAMQGKLSAEYR